MKARDLMTSDPFTVSPTDRLSRAAELMRDIRVGCIPVVSRPGSSELVGMITDRDIAVRCVSRAHGSSCLVRDHMTKGPLQTVHPDADVAEVMERMERAQVRRIPVVSDAGALLGVIAQADLATKLGPKEPLKVEEVLERISAPMLVSA